MFDKDGNDAVSEIMELALDGSTPGPEDSQEGPSGMGIDSGSIRETMERMRKRHFESMGDMFDNFGGNAFGDDIFNRNAGSKNRSRRQRPKKARRNIWTQHEDMMKGSMFGNDSFFDDFHKNIRA